MNLFDRLLDFEPQGTAATLLLATATLLLAALAGLLFFLDWGGMTCGAPRPYRLLWLAGMTVVLSAAAMVGCDEAGSLLLLACQAIAALTVLYRLPRNLNHPPEAPAQPPREEEVEEEPHV